MDFAHTTQNIFDVIFEVLNDFRLTGRIISLTLDNASSNTASINLFLANNVPQAGGHLFHQRCACHIINLVVKSGLKVVSGHIDRIRDAISYISSFNQSEKNLQILSNF